MSVTETMILEATEARMRKRVVGVWVRPEVVTILGASEEPSKS